MKTQIKAIFKSNKTVENIFRHLSIPIFIIQWALSNIETSLRKNGLVHNSKYKHIKSLKNTYKGKRCFVVATGPSLTFEDLELIKDEYTFGMNSGVLAFDKTSWRPSFYGVQDEYVYRKIEKDILNASNSDISEIYVSSNLCNTFKIPDKYKVFPLHYLDHKMPHKKGFGHFKFSDDCHSIVYDGYSIIFSLLQMACYMGFSEIYLIGSDCNYQQPKSHFIQYGHTDPHAAIMGDKIIAGHFNFKKFADERGIQVVNCTRGGMLEVYPRMNLEDVLDYNRIKESNA